MNENLEALIKPVVTGLGCELWGMERIVQGKYSLLKIFIDADDGINVEDCARVSRQVSSLLDVEDPFKGKYTLEVSSPGLDRRLFKLEQFEIFKGARVKLRLNRPYEGRRKFIGLLCGIEDEDVVLRSNDDEEILFPFSEIERANVIPEI
jgi:ribosome maturation factor RimP